MIIKNILSLIISKNNNLVNVFIRILGFLFWFVVFSCNNLSLKPKAKSPCDVVIAEKTQPIIEGMRYEYGRVADICIKDIITGDLLCPMLDQEEPTSYYLYSSKDNGVTWGQITGTKTQQGYQLISSIQDNLSFWHFLHYYAGEACYAKVELIYSNKHVVGWSWSESIALPSKPTLGSRNAASIIIVRNGNNKERIIITAVDGNLSEQYRGIICQTTLSPENEDSFLSLNGTQGEWSVLQTQTQSPETEGPWAPYVFNGSTQPYGSSGNLFTAVGPAGQNDRRDYGCAVVGQRLIAAGDKWTIHTKVETLSGKSYESLLGSSCNYNHNAYFFSSNRAVDSGYGKILISHIAPDGTFIQSVAGELKFGEYSSEPALFGSVTSGGSIMIAELPIDYAVNGENTRGRLHAYIKNQWTSKDLYKEWIGEIVWASAGSSGFKDGLIIISSGLPANGMNVQVSTCRWVW